MEKEFDNILSQKANSNFFSSFFFLPKEKKMAMNTIYSFCRYTDDITDAKDIDIDKKIYLLKKWREEFEKALKNQSVFPLLNLLAQVINRFNIPLEPFFDLIKGMEMDLTKKQYITFSDLLEYCYNVASTVGLMTIEIFGYKHKKTRDYAINLGIALQLTNIIRDLKEDSQNGRIYLPLEDLTRFNYSQEELISNVYNDKFVNLMAFECERAENYYEKANSFLDEADKKSLFAARIMQHIYHSLLQKIKKHNYNVFNNKICISKFRKIYITSGVWLKYSLLYK